MPLITIAAILLVFAVSLAFFFIYRASRYSLPLLIISIVWLVLQSVLSLRGFYKPGDAGALRFPLLAAPPAVAIIMLMIVPAGRRFLDKFDLSMLTLLHVVRLVVEICLYQLSVLKLVPTLITFEGRNWDIFSGLTAPLVWFFVFRKNSGNRNSLLIWNFVCLALLLNVVVTAVLSVPGPLQKLAFDQPNVAVLYFPFTLLPAFIVPTVLLAHVAAIRQLMKTRQHAAVS